MLTAPSEARWSVMNWQSSRVKLPTLRRATSHASATFEASRPAAEHALAEKGPAELHAVDPADEIGVLPHFDRMGVARAVERQHCPLDLGVDPGFVAIGAAGDDSREVAVVGHFEPAAADGSAERPREMEAVERNDRPIARLDPEQLIRVPAVGHRENARGITLEQQARIEPTHRADLTEFRAPCPAAGTGGRRWRFRRVDA